MITYLLTYWSPLETNIRIPFIFHLSFLLTFYSYMKQDLITLQGFLQLWQNYLPPLLYNQRYFRLNLSPPPPNNLVLFSPDLLSDPDNYTLANSLNTTSHIKPEWYFLFAYAILRSIPNKLGGILALVFSILILAVIPVLRTSKQQTIIFRPLSQCLSWILMAKLFTLTWIGGQPIEYPLIALSPLDR